MITRRHALKLGAGALAFQALGTAADTLGQTVIIKRQIPSSGELIPAMGMGTSRTFDTADDGMVVKL